MSCAKKPLVSAAMSPRSSQMQNVDPSRIVEHQASLRTIRPPLDCARALITISSIFTCSGRVIAKRTQSATSSAVSGSTPSYGAFASLLVTLEAHERELGLRESRIDGRDADRPAEEILPQAVDEAAQRELRGHVHGSVLVRLPARDRAGEQDVAAVAHVGQREACGPDRAVDVRVQDGRLVLRVRLGERVAAERKPGIVVEDVDPAELGGRTRDERGAAVLVGDVEREGNVGVDPLHAPRAAHDAHAGLAELAHRRGTEAARRTRDDGRLALELHAPEPIVALVGGCAAAAKAAAFRDSRASGNRARGFRTCAS